MERSVFDITLELQSAYSPTSVTVNRGDTHRTLRLHLADGGRPYPMGEDVRPVLTAIKPDGSHLYNACRMEAGAVVYDLTPQTTVLPGQVECQLRLYGKSRELLTSAAFLLSVADTVYADGDEAIQSAGEVTALTKLITEAGEKISQMDAVLKNEVNHAIIDDTKIGTDAWSGKKIVDMLCPAFSAEGHVASCEPLEGYPLEVISTFDSRSALNNMKLTRCGKNLFDFKKGVEEIHFKAPSGADTMKYGYAIHLPAGTYTIHAEAISSVDQQFVYCYGNDADGNYIDLKECLQGNNVDATWLRQGVNLRPRVFAFDRNVVLYVYQGGSTTLSSAQKALVDEHNIQIEAGSVATAYEDYKGSQWSVDFANVEDGVYVGSYNWQTGVLNCESGMFQCDPQTNTFTYIDNLSTYVPSVVRNIPAQSGVNYLYSDCGDTEVKGRLDIRNLLQQNTSE